VEASLEVKEATTTGPRVAGMEYRLLGSSGMRVSSVGLGCFAFAGDKTIGSHLGQAIAQLLSRV
jgi:hypothetical protein